MNDAPCPQWKQNAREIFGERGYIYALADVCGVAPRTAERWSNGRHHIPEPVVQWLSDIVEIVPSKLRPGFGLLLRAAVRIQRQTKMPAADVVESTAIVAKMISRGDMP